MRRTILLSLPFLALVACDTASEPLAPAAAVWPSLQSAEPDGHVATVLPDGVLSGMVHLVVADEGVVFGSVVHESGANRAARWTPDENGDMTGPQFLGTLPAPFDRADQYVRSASNNGKVVVGYAGTSRSTAGWVWTEDGMTMLPVPDNRRVYPHATNDAGVIAGQIGITVDGVSGDWGVVWFPPYDSEPLLLPRVEGYSLNSARGITNDGLITGWVRGSGMVDRLVQWQIEEDGTVSGPVVLDGIDQILMNAANQNGDAVGSYHGNGEWEPYLFRSDVGRHIDLGLVPGRRATVAGVTNRSEGGSVLAVGRSWSQSSSDDRAFLWSVDGDGTVAGPVDLGVPPDMVTRERPRRTSAFNSAGATSVNSDGWVVGWSLRDDRTYFATLWRPGENSGDDGGGGGEDDDCNPHPRTGKCR